ncbi:MAG: DUF4326 domain-containing protein [Planctomycetes bacterium]|nr:DUF4326 domain-containing protein [Planctomycetota bacterium]
MQTKVCNIKMDKYAKGVYIGRGPRKYKHYGNPFRIGRDGSRADVIKKFEEWLDGKHPEVAPQRRKWVLENEHLLKNRTLLCHCAPEPCHGDVYVKRSGV